MCCILPCYIHRLFVLRVVPAPDFMFLTPNLPTNIVPTNIAWLKYSGKFPVGLGIPPLKINIMLESSPLNSTMLVGRLGVFMCIILCNMFVSYFRIHDLCLFRVTLCYYYCLIVMRIIIALWNVCIYVYVVIIVAYLLCVSLLHC